MSPTKTDKIVRNPIDMEHLGRFTMQDRSLEAEILELFTVTLSQTVKTLNETVEQNEWNMAAHTLKGSARAVGAKQLAMLMEEAEKVSLSAAMAPKRAEILSNLDESAAQTISFISSMAQNA